MKRLRWASSLRVRLLAATLAALALALLLAGVLLSSLFRDHVLRQFETTLTQQLDLLTARLEFDATGQVQIDTQALADPRWLKPFSGLYWQIDQMVENQPPRMGVLRSRSLWDTSLQVGNDVPADGAVHRHEGPGPQDSRLLMIERTVHPGEQPQARWRLIVAADLHDTVDAVARFNGVLALSLALLLILLGLAALAQVAVGLSPLRALQRAVSNVRQGRVQRLQGQFPAEVQPLIDDFNRVLDTNADVVARARTHAGNLAHALKTPLAVMAQATSNSAATSGQDDELARLVQEQVELSRRHIDWHLAHARVAASQRLPGLRTPLQPVLAGLLRVMERVHAHRNVTLLCAPIAEQWAFAGEEQDLQEILGNLLDNAFQWASTTVQVDATCAANRLEITVQDDGPGIAPERRSAALARGVRLDEGLPGSGLGLAIVADLVDLYGGALVLGTGPLGGLSVHLSLPA